MSTPDRLPLLVIAGATASGKSALAMALAASWAAYGSVLTVAAAEAAIGLAILVCFFRNRGSIAVEDVNVMKG